MSPLAFCQYLALPWIGSEVLVFLRDRQRGAGQRRDAASRFAILAAIGVSIFLGIQFARVPLLPLPGPRIVWMVIGGAAVIVGIVVRQRAVWWLGIYFRTRVTLLDEHQLITDGPYARIRHPSYTGAFISCAGYGLALASGASFLILALLPLLALAYRIRVEEAALAERFGDAWLSYRKRTAALIPGVW
jgi:protein-S-isoprenylcysteine O-methyltransferase Ste14